MPFRWSQICAKAKLINHKQRDARLVKSHFVNYAKAHQAFFWAAGIGVNNKFNISATCFTSQNATQHRGARDKVSSFNVMSQLSLILRKRHSTKMFKTLKNYEPMLSSNKHKFPQNWATFVRNIENKKKKKSPNKHFPISRTQSMPFTVLIKFYWNRWFIDSS